ncbi:hypothetical protein AXFE_04340 [Acidithrix ferrooxidans]|uniref:Uncharacterized protein n=1 Tax=Acidithrix ferrooxidans TaxID=1280514 RepID=A0A0D8HL39_9ACTN|nr:hypothetical protein AXFE_04340 [Acidithrix ferrooxidans]
MKERGLFPVNHGTIGKVILCPFSDLTDPRPIDSYRSFPPGDLSFSNRSSSASH